MPQAAHSCGCTTCKCGLRRISSVSTNATADNLPGPGRILGAVYAFLGDKLERSISTFATRFGHGPQAAADAIAHLRRHHQRTISEMYTAESRAQPHSTLSKAKLRKLHKKCCALVRYSTSAVDSTAIAANILICDISIYDPFVCKLLYEYMASLRHDIFTPFKMNSGQQPGEDLDSFSYPLLASSRKALISVTQIGIQKLMSEFYLVTSMDGCISKTDFMQWCSYTTSFKEKFMHIISKDDTLLFLGLRHINHAIQCLLRSISENANNLDKGIFCERSVFIMRLLAVDVGKALVNLILDTFADKCVEREDLDTLLGCGGEKPAWSIRLGLLLESTSCAGLVNNIVLKNSALSMESGVMRLQLKRRTLES